VEPDDFPPFVLGEAVLVEQIEGVVPVATDAEVENAQANFLGDFGEVVFWVRVQAGFNTEGTKNTEATERKKLSPNIPK
jgi:hypothetical protein